MNPQTTADPLPKCEAHPFTVSFVDFNDAFNWSLDLLRSRGYRMIGAEKWYLAPSETPTQYQQRLGISYMTFNRRIKHPDCPTFISVKGPTGRIVSLTTNPLLDAWMAKLQ